MRGLLIILIFLFVQLHAVGQSVFSNEANTVLQTVVQDFNKGFVNIRGDLISRKGQQAEFHSKILFPGSASTTITQTRSGSRDMASWQSTIIRTGSFEEAA